MTYLDKNVSCLREDMANAARAAGRDPSEITLLAAVKSGELDEIRYLHRELGIRDLGENRVQQFLAHYEALREEREIRWHFIGSLQTNKVKYIIDKVCMIHSLDSLRLAAEIEKQMAKLGKTMDVLVEINSGGEENKSGIAPEDAAEFCAALKDFPHVKLCGFMTMAPKCEKNEDYRKFFQETFQLGLDIWEKTLHNIGRPLFSMGMSGNFEIAIEEGADMVRVGRALFAEPQDQ